MWFNTSTWWLTHSRTLTSLPYSGRRCVLTKNTVPHVIRDTASCQVLSKKHVQFFLSSSVYFDGNGNKDSLHYMFSFAPLNIYSHTKWCKGNLCSTTSNKSFLKLFKSSTGTILLKRCHRTKIWECRMDSSGSG